MGEGIGFWGGDGGGIDVAEGDGVVKLGLAGDLFAAQGVDGDVHHDPVNPGVKGGLAAEAADGLPCLEEPVLGEVPGVLLVVHHVVNHRINFSPVTGYELIEGCGITTLATAYEVSVVGDRVLGGVAGPRAALAW